MLQIEGISKAYGDGFKAVNNLNLEVEDGEIFGFIGPNGAGKTTTIKMIVGILKQDEGHIFVNGLNSLDQTIEVKSMISYVPDQPILYEKLTAMEYLNFIGDIYKVEKADREERIERYGKLFEIYDKLDKRLEEYSHGMKQKKFP